MLCVEYNEKYGWTVTKPTDELIDYIINKGWEDIMMNRGALPFLTGSSGNGKPQASRAQKRRKPKATAENMCVQNAERLSERPE